MTFAERFLSVAPSVEAAGRRVKVYHLNVQPGPMPPEVVDAALAFLPRLVAPPDGTPPAAFAVIHSGGDASYVNVYSWVWDNVLECHTAAAGIPFLGCPDEDRTNFMELARPWIGCVWELGPFEHERAAWVRHLLTPDAPGGEGLEAYLADHDRSPTTGGA